LILFIFSCALYGGALKHGFVWDDEAAFVNAPEIRDTRNIPSFFLNPVFAGNDEAENLSAGSIQYYRPLLSTLHVLEYRWFGSNPLGYKVVNLLLNGLVVACAFLLVQTLTGKTTIAFLASLLYAANPARGEVVYWAYSDSHIFAALFSLLTLLAYCRGRLILALSLMVVGLLFQEGVILVAVTLFAYESFSSGSREKSWQRLIPFFSLAAVYLVLRHTMVGALPVVNLDFFTRVRAAAYLVVKHVKIFFVTDAPVTMYRYVPGMFSPAGQATAMIALAAGFVVLLGVWFWLRQRRLFFWYSWFFIWIAMAFNVGAYADYLMAEKSLYLSALGPCVILASLVPETGFRRRVGFLLILVFAGYQSWVTVSRGQYWINTETYIEKLLEFEPAYDVARYQLGATYLQSGQYEKAVGQFETLRTLSSPLGRHRYTEWLLVDAYGRWGQQLAESGDCNRALAVFEKTLKTLPNTSTMYYRLGTVHDQCGDQERAMAAWEKALILDSGNAKVRYRLERMRRERTQ
jgi:hypothetical protein